MGRSQRAVDMFALRWGIISGGLLVLGSLVGLIVTGLRTNSGLALFGDLLLPVAGGVALFAALKLRGMPRAMTTLIAGLSLFLVPLLQILMADTGGRLAMAASMYASTLVVVLGIPLAAVGMAVGSKVREVHPTWLAGRLIAGISGSLMLILLVAPLLPNGSGSLTNLVSVAWLLAGLGTYLPAVAVVGVLVMGVLSVVNYGQLKASRGLAVATMAIGLVLMFAVPMGVVIQGSQFASVLGGKAVLIALTAVALIYGMFSLAPTGLVDLLLQVRASSRHADGPVLLARPRRASGDRKRQHSTPTTAAPPRRKSSSPKVRGGSSQPRTTRRPGASRAPLRRPAH